MCLAPGVASNVHKRLFYVHVYQIYEIYFGKLTILYSSQYVLGTFSN